MKTTRTGADLPQLHHGNVKPVVRALAVFKVLKLSNTPRHRNSWVWNLLLLPTNVVCMVQLLIAGLLV